MIKPFLRGRLVTEGEEKLQEYFKKNLKYPKVELTEDVQVIVRFVIERDGQVGSPKIIESGGEVFDKEALRVIAAMSQWIPGRVSGINIAMYVTRLVILKKAR